MKLRSSVLNAAGKGAFVFAGLILTLLMAFAATLPARAMTGAESGPDFSALIEGKPARKLSAYNIFKDGAKQITTKGFVPYHLNTPLFTDYALKYRFVYVPPGTKATYDAQEAFDFPAGTVLVKTFAYPADMRRPNENIRIIETRLLVRESDGDWAAWPYIWDEATTDAELKIGGRRLDISWADKAGRMRTANYLVPNKNQCKGCHALGKAITPIGPKARHLNGDYPYPQGTENQLAHWARIGLLEGAPAPGNAPRVPRWDAPGDGTLDEKARAYLDINCAHCHRPQGPGDTSGLNLRYDDKNGVARGVYKTPVAAGRGAGTAAYVVHPGEPEDSILLFRMQSTDPGIAMPELGRSLNHDEGIALIRDYIAAMPDPAKN